MSRFLFHRQQLASSFLTQLIGGGFPDLGSGLFLFAPRRTGKSTFLLEDLIPLMRKNKIITIYVDLWSDKNKDPSMLIFEAIQKALHDSDSIISKSIQSSKINKIGFAGVFSFDIGNTKSVSTISEALAALHSKTKCKIAILIDEAQHAFSSENGLNAMFALKSARDTLNAGGEERKLMLVFTGSHRDKLANLILHKNQPFYGARLTNFPFLDKQYIDAYTVWINARLASDNQLNPEDVFVVFDIIGKRPEMLENILSNAVLNRDKSISLKDVIMTNAYHLRDKLWLDFESEFNLLTNIQQAVLSRLIKQGGNASLFSEDSIQYYYQTINKKLDASAIQSALNALCKKNIVWKLNRGAYAIEDQSMIEWFNNYHKKMDNQIESFDNFSVNTASMK